MSEDVDKAVFLEIFRRAMLVFHTDEKMRGLLSGGQLAIAYYSPRGQEVLAAALMSAVRPDDYLVTTYRGIHDQLAKGVPLKSLWAEYAGKASGSCKGKGGPMHITHPEAGVMVTTGIVGGGLPIANGLAWASKIEKDDRVAICTFGDGAANIGAFHEALNMASLWKLPVVFVCQNNRYGEKTKFEYSTSVNRIADRATAYGLTPIRVNGNDPDEMYKVSLNAVNAARRGDGPTLIEAMTFRFKGHAFGDPGDYIPRAEYDAFLAQDPIASLREKCRERDISPDEMDAIEQKIKADVEEAAKFALESQFPQVEELRRDIFEAEINI